MKGRVGVLDCVDSVDGSRSGCTQPMCVNGRVFYVDVELDRWTNTISLSIYFDNVDERECTYDSEDVLVDVIGKIREWFKEVVGNG